MVNYMQISVRKLTMIYTWMLQARTASFTHRHVPSYLNNIREWGVEILMFNIETSFATLGSRFDGVRRLPLLAMVNYVYLMLCPRILGTSQLHYRFLRLKLIGYSNFKDFWSNDLPSVSGVNLNGPPLWVLRLTARTPHVTTTLSLHSNSP
jgi:hypothetical protein